MKFTSSLSRNKASAFNKSLKEEKAKSTRVIAFLGSLIFIIFTVIDYIGLPADAFELVYPFRLASVILLSSILALTFKPIFQAHYNKFLMLGYVSSGISICINIYFSQQGEYSYDLYFATLIILMISAFSWSYLPVKHSIAMSLFFISSYIIIKTYFHKDIEGERLMTLVSHSFLLISVLLIAATGQFIRDNLIYKNIVLQENLKLIAKSKSKEAKKQEKLANMDTLTGIPNRRYITQTLRKVLLDAEKSSVVITLIFIDLKEFKSINDNYGHDLGDQVLQVTAKRIQQSLRNSDYLARLGGDEFIVGLKMNRYSPEFINKICQKLRMNIAAPLAIRGEKLKVGANIGYSCYPADGETIEDLIKIADKHMYLDKENSSISKIQT